MGSRSGQTSLHVVKLTWPSLPIQSGTFGTVGGVLLHWVQSTAWSVWWLSLQMWKSLTGRVDCKGFEHLWILISVGAGENAGFRTSVPLIPEDCASFIGELKQTLKKPSWRLSQPYSVQLGSVFLLEGCLRWDTGSHKDGLGLGMILIIHSFSNYPWWRWWFSRLSHIWLLQPHAL